MKQVTITLVGTLTHGATRSFVVEVPDDVNPTSLNRQVLEDLADQAQIPWSFDADGFLLITDHVIDDDQPSVQVSTLPVISTEPSEV